MHRLNYHHLLYFWTVAREGTIAKACTQLHLTQPTISGQLRALERAIAAKLFTRSGRHLVLTDLSCYLAGGAPVRMAGFGSVSWRRGDHRSTAGLLYAARYPAWMVFTPCIAPILADAVTYVGIVAIGNAVMRLIAGPSRSDRLRNEPRSSPGQ